MDKVSLEGKEYVKAASVARELGYTRDYIGQLCRAKKIDAQLVGRSWYVFLPSLQQHKKNRYQNSAGDRSSKVNVSLKEKGQEFQEANKADLHELKISVRSDKKQEDAPRPAKSELAAKVVSRRVNYENHLDKYRPVKYVVDDAELFPAVQHLQVDGGSVQNKPKNLSSTVIDVQVTEAEENAADYYLERVGESAPLRGSLTISDFDESKPLAAEKKELKAKNFKEIVKSVEDVSLKSKPNAALSTQAKSRKKKSSNKQTVKLDPVSKMPVGPMSDDEFPYLSKNKHTLVKTEAVKDPVPGLALIQASLFSPITLSVLAGTVVCSLAIGLSWKLDFTNADIDKGYELNVSNIIGAQ